MKTTCRFDNVLKYGLGLWDVVLITIYPTDIPHTIILSNIRGVWGGMFHVKHERLFAFSWGLFHFHTSGTPLTHLLENHPHLLKIHPLTTNKSHNHAIYKGWGEYLHQSLKTSHITTYPYPITVSFPIYIHFPIHLLTTYNCY